KRRTELRLTDGTIVGARKERKLVPPRSRSASGLPSAVEIKETLSLAEEFQRDGHHLRRDGKSLKCLCPFHEERAASCYINPDKGVFHCFGCGASGSVIDYHSLKRDIPP